MEATCRAFSLGPDTREMAGSLLVCLSCNVNQIAISEMTQVIALGEGVLLDSPIEVTLRSSSALDYRSI